MKGAKENAAHLSRARPVEARVIVGETETLLHMNVGCLGWGDGASSSLITGGENEGRKGGGKDTRWRRDLELISFLVRSVQSMEAHSMAVGQHHLLRA